MAETNPQNEENQSSENKPAEAGNAPKTDTAAPKEGNGSGASEKPEAGSKPAGGDKPDAGAKPEAPAGGDKPAAAKPAAPAGGGDKPAPKAAPKAAAKPKEEKKPLIDNGDGTITDPNTGLMWKKTDAWLDTKKFYTWPQAPEYVDKINGEKFAGHTDWRIPSKAEAASLVDKNKKHMDKNGTEYPFDPIFEIGCAAVTWITECSEEKVIRFDYKIGSEFTYPPCELWSSIRLVRDAEGYEETLKKFREGPSKPAAKPAPKPGAPAAGGDKPAAGGAKPAAPAGGGDKPAEGTAKPAEGGDKPSAPEKKPDTPPAGGEAKSDTPEKKPEGSSEGESKPDDPPQQ